MSGPSTDPSSDPSSDPTGDPASDPAGGSASGPAGDPAADPADDPVRIRAMTADDCEAVATVRVRGWRYAYAGLMPQAYLDAMSVEEDAARRREYLAGGEGRVTDLVAEARGRVIGWGCCGPSRDADAPAGSAELYALYVLPERLSTGVGRALMDALADRAVAEGASALLLWVLADNERARSFYAKAGFAPDGAREPFEVGGVEVPEVRYARRLSASSAAPPSRG